MDSPDEIIIAPATLFHNELSVIEDEAAHDQQTKVQLHLVIMHHIVQ